MDSNNATNEVIGVDKVLVLSTLVVEYKRKVVN